MCCKPTNADGRLPLLVPCRQDYLPVPVACEEDLQRLFGELQESLRSGFRCVVTVRTSRVTTRSGQCKDCGTVGHASKRYGGCPKHESRPRRQKRQKQTPAPRSDRQVLGGPPVSPEVLPPTPAASKEAASSSSSPPDTVAVSKKAAPPRKRKYRNTEYREDPAAVATGWERVWRRRRRLKTKPARVEELKKKYFFWDSEEADDTCTKLIPRDELDTSFKEITELVLAPGVCIPDKDLAVGNIEMYEELMKDEEEKELRSKRRWRNKQRAWRRQRRREAEAASLLK